MSMLVENAESPPAAGTKCPRFFWKVPLEGGSRRQTMYQILMATSEDLFEPGKAGL